MGGALCASQEQSDIHRPAEPLLEPGGILEDHVGGEFDLADAVAVGRVDGVSLPVRKAGSQPTRPVVAALAPVSFSLELLEIGGGQEGIVVLLEGYSPTGQLLGHEGVAVQSAGHIEGEIRRHPETHRPHDRVQHVEVVVEKLLATCLDETVVGIAALGFGPRGVGDEGSPCSMLVSTQATPSLAVRR